MPPNTGSFGSAIGGSQELMAAMQRRGIDVGAAQATSPASAVGAPVPPAPDMASASMALGGQPASAAPAAEEPESDLRIALSALTKFVGDESKLKKDVITLRGQGVI